LTIQYASDLHLEVDKNKEYLRKHPLVPKADVLILAGDIMLFSEIESNNDFIDYCSNNFQMVYWLPGNHEYYHSYLPERNAVLNESIRSNVMLVNNIAIKRNEVRLLFSPLWSAISEVQEEKILRRMDDFKFIKQGDGLLTIKQYNQLHADCLSFIKEELAKPFKGQNIVVTHHVPTLKNYPAKYLKQGLNEAFAVELKDYIEVLTNTPYWIYGHHHKNVADFEIGNTKLITNQLGYVEGKGKGFDSGKVVGVL